MSAGTLSPAETLQVPASGSQGWRLGIQDVKWQLEDRTAKLPENRRNSFRQLADQFAADLVWMDNDHLLPGRQYLLKSMTRTVPAQVTDLKYRLDVDALVDRSKSLNEGAITFPNFTVGTWYHRIFTDSGFFDNDKPLRDFTDAELERLLHGPEAKVKTELVTLTYEGLVDKIRRLYLVRDPESLQANVRAAVERISTSRPPGAPETNAVTRRRRLKAWASTRSFLVAMGQPATAETNPAASTISGSSARSVIVSTMSPIRPRRTDADAGTRVSESSTAPMPASPIAAPARHPSWMSSIDRATETRPRMPETRPASTSAPVRYWRVRNMTARQHTAARTVP